MRVLPLLQLSSNTIRQGLFQEKMQRSQVRKIWLVSSMGPGMIQLSWKWSNRWWKKRRADFNQVKLVPNSDSNSITPIENKVFDAAWIYHGWDGILAEQKGMKTNFFYMKDFVSAFDYYSPVIIANNDYLKSHKEEAKKFIQAVKKGLPICYRASRRSWISWSNRPLP